MITIEELCCASASTRNKVGDGGKPYYEKFHMVKKKKKATLML